MLAALDEVADELSRRRRAQLGRVVLLRDQDGTRVDREAERADLLLGVASVRASVEKDKETAVGERADPDRNGRAVDVDGPTRRRRARGRRAVLDVFEDKLERDNRGKELLGRALALVEDALVLGNVGLGSEVSLGRGTADDSEGRVGAFGSQTRRDELVEPSRGDRVLLERLRFEELDEVLDGRAEVTTDREFLERDDHVLARLGTVRSVRKDVTELRIGKLVETTGRTDREVTPDVGARTEVELLESTHRRLESGVGVLGRDTDGDDVTLRRRLALGLGRLGALKVKVDPTLAVGRLAVEGTDVADAVEGDTHGDLELSRGQVDARDHLGSRMLDLKTRVELEEGEAVVAGRVQELDSTRRDVTDELGETDRRLFHLLEALRTGDRDGRLFDDLLVATLDRAVTAEQRDGIAVLVGDDLDLEVTRSSGELHDEDRRSCHFRRGCVSKILSHSARRRGKRTGNLGQDSLVGLLEVGLAVDLADTLSSASLRSLDHDREADALSADETLLGVVNARLVVDVILDRDVAVFGGDDLVDTLARPVHARNLSVLSDDSRRDLVSEGAHGRSRGTDEDDLVFRRRERFGKARVFRGVTPVHSPRV